MRAEKRTRPKTQPEINKFRRESLISAAIRVVAEHGIENATMAKIGEAASVSGGLAAHYFDSKEDLILQAYQKLLDDVFEITAKAAGIMRHEPLKQIKAIVAAVFGKELFTETNRAAYLRFWTASLSNAQLLKLNRDAYQKQIEAIERLMRRAAEDLSASIDAKRAAVGLVGMMDGLWLDMSLAKNSLNAKLAVDLCSEYVDMMLARSGRQ